MSIKVKAVERKLNFVKNTKDQKGQESQDEYRYIMSAETYSKLSQNKVIQEASLRSGLSKLTLNAAWGAIGDVVMAWTTEGHSVAIPGLGTIRFGLRATSVADVNKVASSLITCRRIIFTPSSDIKRELAQTPVNITCYDRTGKIVKDVDSDDDGSIEDNEDNANKADANPDGNE